MNQNKNPNFKVIQSLAFVILIAFVTHYFFVSQIQSKDRDVASYGERNSVEQIQWEQNLAKDLAEGKMKALMPSKVSWQDVFFYEFLKGQYNISMSKGVVEKISLQNQQEGVEINISEFMSVFGPKFKNYSKFQTIKNSNNSETVELQDSSGQSAGQFLFQRNDQGRVVEIVIQ